MQMMNNNKEEQVQRFTVEVKNKDPLHWQVVTAVTSPWRKTASPTAVAWKKDPQLVVYRPQGKKGLSRREVNMTPKNMWFWPRQGLAQAGTGPGNVGDGMVVQVRSKRRRTQGSGNNGVPSQKPTTTNKHTQMNNPTKTTTETDSSMHRCEVRAGEVYTEAYVSRYGKQLAARVESLGWWRKRNNNRTFNHSWIKDLPVVVYLTKEKRPTGGAT